MSGAITGCCADCGEYRTLDNTCRCARCAAGARGLEAYRADIADGFPVVQSLGPTSIHLTVRWEDDAAPVYGRIGAPSPFPTGVAHMLSTIEVGAPSPVVGQRFSVSLPAGARPVRVVEGDGASMAHLAAGESAVFEVRERWEGGMRVAFWARGEP